MKIIKKGSPKAIVFRGSCFQCGCEVECEKSEVKRSESDGPNRPGSEYVDCPTRGCTGMIFVKEATK